MSVIINNKNNMIRKKQILIVDDNKITCDLMKNFLNINSSYDVICCYSGFECLRILQNYSIDLVIIDVNMPDLDGRFTVSNIRTSKKYGHIPVIMMSSNDYNNDSKNLKCDIFLQKPFSMFTMNKFIHKILNEKKDN